VADRADDDPLGSRDRRAEGGEEFARASPTMTRCSE
jgi:hypothetical protein